MPTNTGCAPVAGPEDVVCASRVTKHIVRVDPSVGVVLEGVRRSGKAGADNVNGNVVRVSEAARSRAVLFRSGEGETGDQIGVRINAVLPCGIQGCACMPTRTPAIVGCAGYARHGLPFVPSFCDWYKC